MIRTGKWFTENKIILRFFGVMILFCCQLKVNAQAPPPRPFTVTANPSLGLRFGAFYVTSSGGTVVIDAYGSRTSTGGVVLASLGFGYGAANFEIQANPGTIISIMNGPDATLTGSAGGTLTVHLGACSPSSPFITSVTWPSYTSVNIGGTLTVGSSSANPTGTYSGSINVTFVRE